MFARLVLWILLALFAVSGTLLTILFASTRDHGDEFPRRLRDMHVGDDGAFACTAHFSDDTLRLMLVGADGAIRFDSRLAYEFGSPDSPSYPLSLGVIVEQRHDRVLFRIAHEDGGAEEEWRIVRWSSGELISSLRPTQPYERSEAYCSLNLVKPIAGTPLLVCYWSVISLEGSPRGAARGAHFAVTDFDAKTVWELDLPHDYDAGGVERDAGRLWYWARGSDVLLTSSAPNHFEIVLAADAQRVTFEMSADGQAKNGWAVNEVSRENYTIDFDARAR